MSVTVSDRNKAAKQLLPTISDDLIILHVHRAHKGKGLVTSPVGKGRSRYALIKALDAGKSIEIDCSCLDREDHGGDAPGLLQLLQRIGQLGVSKGLEVVELTISGLDEQLSTDAERSLIHPQTSLRLTVTDRQFTLSEQTRTVYSPSFTVSIAWQRSKRTAQLLKRLIKRDGSRCAWCGQELEINSLSTTVDHVLPRSAGGPDGIRNLILACASCNHQRYVTPADEWLRHCIDSGLQPVLPVVLAALRRSGLPLLQAA